MAEEIANALEGYALIFPEGGEDVPQGVPAYRWQAGTRQALREVRRSRRSGRGSRRSDPQDRLRGVAVHGDRTKCGQIGLALAKDGFS